MTEKEESKVKELFETTVNKPGASVVLKALTGDDQPVMITRPEFMRRMKEMQAMQGMNMGDFPDAYNVVVNTNHPLVADKLLKMRNEEKKTDFVQHLYNLALLNQGMLSGPELTKFINRSIEFLK